ncbi:uroporphyrinogen-III synthase [Sphingobium scionense]
MTSAQTVRFGGAALQAYRALPTYAVGAATAEALQEAGFVDPVAGDGDASAIAARIAPTGTGPCCTCRARRWRRWTPSRCR